MLVPPYRNPFLAAHQVATLDVLSAGRVTLGLGTGYLRGEFRTLGVDLDDRRRTFDEDLGVMREVWAGREVVLDAAAFSAPGTQVLPLPVQQPHPPLWIHGNGPWAMERAARELQGCIFMVSGPELVRTIRTLPIPDVDTLARRIDEFKRRVVAHGREPDDLDVVVHGTWPMLDVRKGWSVDERLEQVAALEALGATWVVSTCCGDDPVAAEDTVSTSASRSCSRRPSCAAGPQGTGIGAVIMVSRSCAFSRRARGGTGSRCGCGPRPG